MEPILALGDWERLRRPTMFTAAKDAMASQAARRYVNGLIARYGEVSDLKIDSRAKSIDVTCQLIGERDPVTIRVESYSIEKSGEKSFVEIKNCTCSKPWLQNLLQDHARGRRLELPSWAAAVL